MTIKFSVLTTFGLVVLLAASAPAQTTFKFNPVIRAGDAATAPPKLGSILEFSSNEQGSVAVIGDGGLFIKSNHNITVVAAPGDPAPGGGFFLSEENPFINSQGDVVFRGNVSFPSTSGLFLFSKGHLTEILADGTLAPNGSAISPLPEAMNASGDLVILNEATSTLYLFSKGTLTPIVATGQDAPGGGTFSFFINASINQADQIAFEAFLSNGGSGIYLASSGTLTKIIASGDAFPDGGTFAFPFAPSINDSGQIAFGGLANNSAADAGLFLFSNGQLKVVVTEGTSLPGGKFLDFPIVVSMNNASQIAFVGIVSGATANGTAVFLFSQGQLTALEVPGQAAPDGGTFTNEETVGATINGSGQVIFLGAETDRGNTLFRSSQGHITKIVGQGDLIAAQPRFTAPIATGIGRLDTVLISDTTFPGGSGFFTARPDNQSRLIANSGKSLGADGVVDFVFGAAINRHNQVALIGTSSAENNTLLLSTRHKLSVLADSSSTAIPESAVAINNLGEVAFTGVVRATGQSGVFLDAGGQETLLVDAATPLPTGGRLTLIENPSLNILRQVAFLAQLSSPSPNAIYLSTAGQVTPLARDGDPAPGGGNFSIPFGDARFGPVINDQGQVAFATFLTGTAGGFFSSEGVFLSNQGTVTRIVGPGDPSPDGGTFLSADSPSINAAGQVAFFAETSVPSFGVFLYANGAITKVAVAGDFAGQEEFAFADLPVINDNGHVAFTAELLNGTNAIYVAQLQDPTDKAALLSSITAAAPLSLEEMKNIRSTNSWLLKQRLQRKNSRQPLVHGHVIASH
jgi:hypothetical protein